MYSYGPPHMAEQKQDDQLEHTYSSYVRIRDVALKTGQRWWTIRRSGERGSGISALVARHDDDDDDLSIVILKWAFNYLLLAVIFDILFNEEAYAWTNGYSRKKCYPQWLLLDWPFSFLEKGRYCHQVRILGTKFACFIFVVSCWKTQKMLRKMNTLQSQIEAWMDACNYVCICGYGCEYFLFLLTVCVCVCLHGGWGIKKRKHSMFSQMKKRNWDRKPLKESTTNLNLLDSYVWLRLLICLWKWRFHMIKKAHIFHLD